MADPTTKETQGLHEYAPEALHAPVSRVMTSGHDNEIIHIGHTRVYRHELMAAFGGYMNVGLREIPTRKFANTSSLGLFSLSLTTWVLGLCLVGTRGVAIPNILIGLLLFDGIALILVGMWEVVVENTFGYVAFGSYGVFFLSLAAIFMDETFHIQSAYLELDPTGRMLNNAIGLYLTGWLILTTMLLICTVRSTVPLFSTFLCLDLLFMLLTAGYMSGSASVMRGAGGVALATAILGFYNSFAGVATKENSWVELKPLFMPGAQRPDAPDLEKSANDYSSKN